MERSFTCITCPNGCKLNVKADEKGKLIVTGNKCKKGIEFAKNEVFNPMRTLTSTVKTAFPQMPYFPVRTDGEIPKEMVFSLMDILRKVTVTKPLKVGDIVLKDVLGTSVNVIATMNATEDRYGE